MKIIYCTLNRKSIARTINKRGLLLLIVLFPLFLNSQSNFKRNSIYVEVGGNGLLTSFNYDKQLTKKPGLGFRIGAGFYSPKPFQLTIPVGINYLYKLKNDNSYMEFGLGATWTKADVELYIIAEHRDVNYKNTHYLNVLPSMGYRRHTKKSFMWRLSLTPIINQYGFIPFLGIAAGKLF